MQTDQIFVDKTTASAYAHEVELLWYHGLVEAHEAIKAAKAVLESPVHWLLNTGPGPTLEWIARVFLERAALRIINALTEGEDEQTLNLSAMRKKLLAGCRPELVAELTAEIDGVFAECDLGEMRSRAIRHRHNLLAHMNRKHFTDPQMLRGSLLSMHELEEMLARAKRMLNVLAVQTTYGFDLHRFSEEDSMRFVVETLLRTSTWLNLPEREDPLVFKVMTQDFTPEQRRIFIEWRAKLGLPPVELPSEQ